MSESEKPFACSEVGCEMAFTNEDHLSLHQKKHDLMLNLGLTRNSDVADLTPTPTRFIRNCEEVGLFQDLQNVNPFDEYFKKAVEVTKNGGTLEVPDANSDDTLHTPHILPHIEENKKKLNCANNRDDSNSQLRDKSYFSLNIITVSSSPETCANIACRLPTPETRAPIAVIDDEDSDCETNIKKKIKKALQDKGKQKNEKDNPAKSAGPTSSTAISVVPFQNLVQPKETATRTQKEKSSAARSSPDDEKEKIREMNRAAQLRCRKRKQMKWKEMEEELYKLTEENDKLKTENYQLQFLLSQLSGKPLAGSKGSTLTEENEKLRTENCHLKFLLSQISGKPVAGNKGANCAAITPRKLPLLKIAQKKPLPPAAPILIQVLPSTSNITPSPVVPPAATYIKMDNIHRLSSKIERSEQKKTSLRKIIPKITIEN